VAAVSVDDLAVENDVRGALGQGPLERFPQSRCFRGEHAGDLAEVAVGGGLRQAEARAEPADVTSVPEPGQPEQGLAVTAELAGTFPGPDRTAARGEQAGNEPDQVLRDVEHDTIRGHAEPLGGQGYFGEISSTGGSASSPAMSAYVRVSARTTHSGLSDRFTAAENTSLVFEQL